MKKITKILCIMVIVILGNSGCGKKGNENVKINDSFRQEESEAAVGNPVSEKTENDMIIEETENGSIDDENVGPITVGDKIEFGQFVNNNAYVSGNPCALVWQVLAIEGNRALIITDYSICQKPYNLVDPNQTYGNEASTWEDSTLRKWLLSDFLNNSFTDEERAKIIPTNISTADGGNDSLDEVFIFSRSEVEIYFPDDFKRMAPFKENDSTLKRNGTWWLRTPESTAARKQQVDKLGRYSGGPIGEQTIWVRPSMRIDITGVSRIGKIVEYERILGGDFSCIEGKYTNKKGESITIDKDGGFVNSVGVKSEINIELGCERNADGSYTWGYGNESDGYFAGMFFPVGVEVPNVPSEVAFDRLGFGHDVPLEDDVFYREKTQ